MRNYPILKFIEGSNPSFSGSGTLLSKTGELINYSSEHWYDAMSFIGLQKTDAWNKLDHDTQDLHSSIIDEETKKAEPKKEEKS